MSELPTWDQLRALMLSPKPPMACTVYAIGKEPVRVICDGAGAWFMDDGTTRELRTGADRSLLDGPEGLARHDGAYVHVFGWATSAIEPRSLGYLAEADGRVLRREEERRRAIVADVDGLRREGDATFRLWVDEETGSLLRMERPDDPAPLVVLEDVRVGRVEASEPSVSSEAPPS